jgi:hypothetical protein
MKLPNQDEFLYKECEFSGDKCWLIVPNDMGTKWDDDNFRFRSCIVRQSDNFVISQSFGKFVNFGERPEFQPWDFNAPFEARHKIDGSLLIVSEYKGELIIRTRGTTDARQMNNGHEIDILIEKYPVVFDNFWFEMGWTLLLEWTTPSNIIVLREHDEPTLTLVGMVRNETCEYASQEALDYCANACGANRPQKYEYNSIAECIADVAAWSGKEGVVIYQGQTMKKIKADEYCELHKMATGITGVNTVLDVFMASPRFTKSDDFYHYIETTLDYEIAEKCKEYIVKICEAYNRYLVQSAVIESYVELLRDHETRKEQAQDIQTRFKGLDVGQAFTVLDNRAIDDKLIRKQLDFIIETL